MLPDFCYIYKQILLVLNRAITCFLIDDDKDEYDIFCIAINRLNRVINCEYAPDAKHALSRIDTDLHFHPDLIFIDINMPCMNGVECLSEIKKVRRLREVPVYMYSTSSIESIVDECKKLGAMEYIVKPVSIIEIGSVLSDIINRLEMSNPS